MRIWLQENPPGEPFDHAPVASLTEPAEDPYASSYEVELRGAEGKVLVDREALRVALVDISPEGRGYNICRWPDCDYHDAYSDKRAHSGTCPLEEA